MLHLLIFALFGCVIETTYAACPNGFELTDGTCYFFSHGEETWIGAYESCKLFGAMLVEVNSAAEDSYLINRTSQSGVSWWIGLADKLIEGEYMWETSMTVLTDSDYTNWAAGEPNNHRDENCVEYSYSKHYTWKDTECDHLEHFICEKGMENVNIIG